MIRAQWAELLAPGVRKWIDDAYDAPKSAYQEIFHVETSTKAFEEDVDSTGIGYLEATGEQEPARFADPIQGYVTRYTHQTFRKGIQISKELYDDDQTRLMRKRSTWLGTSAKRTYDYQAFSVFRNGFNTAFTSYGDGKPLFSTNHTRKDGGTAQSNASSTGLVLSDDNLETGLQALRNVVDNAGQLINVGDAGRIVLLVPLALEKTAVRITESELVAGSQNNDINIYRGKIDVIATRWIGALAGGSNTAWYLIDMGAHQLNFFMREAFNIDEDYETLTRTLIMIGNTRFSFGWSDWRGVWGSKGDAQAYSS